MSQLVHALKTVALLSIYSILPATLHTHFKSTMLPSPIPFSSPVAVHELSAALTSPHLNLIEFVCAANGSPNDTLIPPVKGDECLHALAAQSMLVIIFLIWWIPPHPTLPGNEIISHFDN